MSFRTYEHLIYELGLILGYEASRNLTLTDINVKEKFSRRGKTVNWRAGRALEKKPVIVSTVRSGLVMASAMRSIIATPYMSHIGIYDIIREVGESQHRERVREAKEFMVTMPDDYQYRNFIVADLFIDRGMTAALVINILLEYGILPGQITFVALIISAEGREKLVSYPEFQGVKYLCARLDRVDDPWLPDFQGTNIRLFRTKDDREQAAEPS